MPTYIPTACIKPSCNGEVKFHRKIEPFVLSLTGARNVKAAVTDRLGDLSTSANDAEQREIADTSVTNCDIGSGFTSRSISSIRITVKLSFNAQFEFDADNEETC